MKRRNNAGKVGKNVSRASLDRQMQAYDGLPESVRRELANASRNWSAYTVARNAWQWPSTDFLVQKIREVESKIRADHEARIAKTLAATAEKRA